jgi:hypothetical protein
MNQISSCARRVVGLCTLGLTLVVFQVPGASQLMQRVGDDASLTYTRGQAIEPVFHGWQKSPDGTFELYFSYVNRNWQEHPYIPIGPDNNIQPEPFGPDGGQPTYFYPRFNRWIFTVRVPADFGSKEVIWSVTAHGQTYRAYGTLEPGYAVDEFMIMHEFGNGENERNRPKPTLEVEGEKRRTARVGQSLPLVATADAPPVPNRPRGGRGYGQPGNIGGDLVRGTAYGLYLAWLVYRGDGGQVTFDPPIPFKVWEDQRGGSPWSPGWVPPPIPPGKKWIHNVTFHEAGTYVLRAQVRDGYQFRNEDITFTVTP